MLFFFFSSRRRHTRFDCDWSSDVCSSDLLDARPHGGRDVEGQAGRVEVAFLEVIGAALANPRLGVRIRGRTRTDADALARAFAGGTGHDGRSGEHTSELQAQSNLVCRLLPVKKTSAPLERWR